DTSTPTPYNTPVTPTNTPTNTPTDTATPTPTNTPTYTATSTPTNTPTNTVTSTPTNTPTNTSTPTITPTPTNTPTITITPTSTSTPTITPTTVPTTYKQYIPIAAAWPELVASVRVEPSKSTFAAGEPVRIIATITNLGTTRSSPVWADLFINPSSPPTRTNIRWNDACGMNPCFGIAWEVPSIAPGQSITLTSDPGNFGERYSVWPGWFAAGTRDLYLYVDSWNPGVATGGSLEENETNNRAELHGLQVTGSNPQVTRDTGDVQKRPVR
ncbi:MAG TPA: hypothetical protein VGD69_27870, partial [Herpetosiphonaceae bacterium]